jgi:homoserine dehydrogenase
MKRTKPLIEYRPLRVALLGAGSVGGQVARLLIEHKAELAARVGAELELIGVAVRDTKVARPGIAAELMTTDAESLILGADIVVELMGGIEPARTYVLQALNSGADVVTANKALLATHGPEIFDVAEQVGAQLYYEAAVAGAIPIIRPLRESLAGDKVTRIMGIVNGTTNYILDRMNSTGATFDSALAEAQALGYAEADPTADVEAYDAAQKAAILASLAFHTEVPLDKVYREGITKITQAQMEAARRDNLVIKLLAIAEKIDATETEPEGISVRVYPTLIPVEHPLGAVRGAYNAVFVEAEAAGQLMFYGAGAGGLQTASAVLGDLVSAAKRHVAGGPGLADSVHANLPTLSIDRVVTQYQITVEVSDQPGVLAQVANIFSAHQVSIETVEQMASVQDGKRTGTATLEIGTHKATDASLSAVVEALRSTDSVVEITSVIRVEGV